MLRATDRAGLQTRLGGMPPRSVSGVHFENWSTGQAFKASPLASASGTGYRNSFAPNAAVPEPAAWVLCGMRLSLAAVAARRRGIQGPDSKCARLPALCPRDAFR